MISRTLFLAAIAVCVGSCAGGPRRFDAVLSKPPTQPEAFAAALEECRSLVGDSRGGQFGRDAAASGAGAVTGVGVVAAGTPAVLTTSVSLTALAAGAIILAPVGSYLVSRCLRDSAERRIAAQMTAFLQERGYRVVEWRAAEGG